MLSALRCGAFYLAIGSACFFLSGAGVSVSPSAVSAETRTVHHILSFLSCTIFCFTVQCLPVYSVGNGVAYSAVPSKGQELMTSCGTSSSSASHNDQ